MNYKAVKHYILSRLDKELSPDLTYHGLHHTLDVLSVTEELCKLEKISGYETKLLKTAALFHDSGFMISNQDHENIGCLIAKETLPQFDYNPSEIELICGMILATKIPQNPQNFLEKILCDADLDYLGRGDFYAIGETLYQEFLTFNVVDNFEDWNRIQVKFLNAHHFFTPTNLQRRSPRKAQYIEELEDLVASYT